MGTPFLPTNAPMNQSKFADAITTILASALPFLTIGVGRP
jgi:hypothetical protein